MDTLPLKTFGKRLLHPFYHHSQGNKPDIFIFSSQRSGSTLLFDMIASQTGMKAVGEPFQERKQDVIARYLPHVYSRYVELDHAMAAGLNAYMTDLLEGRFVGGFERSYDLTNTRHHRVTNRNAVKILRANHLIPWFHDRFPGKHVLLLRHPIPVSRSRERNGWDPPVESFMAQGEWFGNLTSDQRDFVRRYQSGEAIQRHLLVWCLEHTGLDQLLHELQADRSGVLSLPYERLIANPQEVLHRLATFLEIQDIEGFMLAFQRPSRSSRYSEQQTTEAIRHGDRSGLIEGWLKTVHPSIVSFAHDALEVFEIPWYRADDPYPSGLDLMNF